MKLIKLQVLSGALLLSFSFLAQGQGQVGIQGKESPLKLSDVLPIGPQVKVGKLANGLTYYVQKNARPEKKLELRLVVKAGSILELSLIHISEPTRPY